MQVAILILLKDLIEEVDILKNILEYLIDRIMILFMLNYLLHSVPLFLMKCLRTIHMTVHAVNHVNLIFGGHKHKLALVP